MNRITTVMIILLTLSSMAWAQDELSAPANNSPAPPATNTPPAALPAGADASAQLFSPLSTPAGVANSAQALAAAGGAVAPPASTLSPAVAAQLQASQPQALPSQTMQPAAMPSPATPSSGAQSQASQSPADISQFQKWLANNSPNSQQKIPPPPFVSNQSSGPESAPPSLPPKPKKHYARIKPQTGPDAPVVESPPLSYEKSQQIMLSAAPQASTPTDPDSEEVFNNMMKQNVPLTPQQVVRLRQLIDNSQRAAAIPPTVPPKPVSSTLLINLAPGSTPPAIRLAQGYVSSLVFVDSTGAPWPVASYDLGDPKATTIQWDGKSNILLIQAVTPYSESNLVLRLVGLPTPISLELVSGQRVVDYRTDIHVSGLGPESKELPTGSGLPESASQLLLNVLDGVAPPGSKPLKVSGGDCMAWLLGNKMYLRTRLTVLSPGWVGKMTSPDGMYAYEMQQSSSVLVSQYGEPIELKIEGF